MRIDTLASKNSLTQGSQRRTWLRQHSPQHLEQCAALILQGLQKRPADVSQNALVLGAGACTEIPLMELVRSSDEVVLVDFDLAALRRGCEVLASAHLRKRVSLLQCDISGDLSRQFARSIKHQPWDEAVSQGASAVLDLAALCLESCPVPDPPDIRDLGAGEFGLIISSLVLTQLFSYPLLDMLDHVQRLIPEAVEAQERHSRYQNAAQAFRIRVIQAHLHLLRHLLDVGGTAVLLSDIRGFVFHVQGTDHDAAHRRMLPLVPRSFPTLVQESFCIGEKVQWEWVTDLPEKDRPGRGYEVIGYILGSEE